MALGLFVYWTNIRAVDFGQHYDESHPILEPIKEAIRTGLLLPRNYQYPSFCHYLGLIGLTPDVAKFYSFHLDQDLSNYLLNIITSDAYILRMRAIVIFLSSMSIVSLFVTILVWRKNWVEALIGSSVLGLSWETAYHSRFFTADSLMMLFGSIVIMFLMIAYDSDHPYRYLRFAAIAAGLTCGCKYTGGLFLAPVTLALYQLRHSFKQNIWSITIKIIATFILTYLLTTPGTLLDPIEFWRWVSWQMNTYSSGHGGFTVQAGLPHLFLMIGYFIFALFSHFSFIAVFLFLNFLIGIYQLIINGKEKGLVVLIFPILYLYLFSMQQVMIVRNLIVLTPIFSLCVARGFVFVYEKVRNTILRWSIGVTCAVALFTNAAWLFYASETIRNRKSADYIPALSKYIHQHPDTIFLASPLVGINLIAYERGKPKNVTYNRNDNPSLVVFYESEISREVYEHWRPNRFNYVYKWFGPFDINLNYYDPYLIPNARVIILRIKDATTIGL